jgi:hypothetical protein
MGSSPSFISFVISTLPGAFFEFAGKRTVLPTHRVFSPHHPHLAGSTGGENKRLNAATIAGCGRRIGGMD